MKVPHDSRNSAPEAHQKIARDETVGVIVEVSQPRQGRKKCCERFCRPVRGFVRFKFDAHGFTVGYFRSPLRGYVIVTAALSFVFGGMAETTNGLSEAEANGQQLVQKIRANLGQKPSEEVAETGVLIVRSHSRHSKIPVQFRTTISATNWSASFEASNSSNRTAFVVVHKAGEPDEYRLFKGLQETPESLTGNGTMVPFADSDFWAVDLALQFFYWPEQKILKPYEMRRGRSCKVLESINPHPSPNAYSRVVSWIDNETLGIVQAEAYDVKGKLLKEFYPKDFKKVNGQWEVGEMEMINDQTGSRSWIEFDLNQRH